MQPTPQAERSRRICGRLKDVDVVRDLPSPLGDLPIQYTNFAHWQQQWVVSLDFESQLNYWKQQLGSGPVLLQLPTDYPRPPVRTYQGASQCLIIPKSLTNALKQLSQQHNVTLFVTLLAALKILLFYYTGQSDIIVGTQESQSPASGN